jgi:hypothetical protein
MLVQASRRFANELALDRDADRLYAFGHRDHVGAII